MSTETVYKGYTREALDLAFGKVHDPDDWKAPILARVAGEDVQLTVAAIEFFTATNPQVTYNHRGGVMPFIIESEGYRAGPAGDH